MGVLSTYTVVLDVAGGTYIDQVIGSSPQAALVQWAKSCHQDVLYAFKVRDPEKFFHIVKDRLATCEGSLVLINGLQSVWFTSLPIIGIEGYINIIKTYIE